MSLRMWVVFCSKREAVTCAAKSGPLNMDYKLCQHLLQSHKIILIHNCALLILIYSFLFLIRKCGMLYNARVNYRHNV